MKRIISCIILIALCVFLCVTSSIIVENKAEKLKLHLDLLEKEIINESYLTAAEYIVSLEEEWSEAEKIFSSLSETQLIDELDLYFSSLEKYIEAGETGHAIIVIEECRNGLEIICDYQKITIENIL